MIVGDDVADGGHGTFDLCIANVVVRNEASPSPSLALSMA